MESGELRPDHGPAEPHPQRRRDPGHRPPAARRLQRRARQRRRRGRPRRRRRPARVGRRPARRAGDRPRPRQRPRPGLDQRPRPGRRRRSALVVERVRELAAPLGARPGRGRAGRPDPGGGAGRLPGRTCRSAASTPPATRSSGASADRAAGPPRPTRFRAVAQTKKKRRKKHRGTQGGRIDTKRRARPRSREEAKAQARSRRGGGAAQRRRPPTWRSSIIRGVVAAADLLRPAPADLQTAARRRARPRRLHARLLHPGRLLHRHDDVAETRAGADPRPARRAERPWRSRSRCSPSARSPRTASCSAARAPTGS